MSIESQEVSSGVRDVNWLLDNFVHHTTGVEHPLPGKAAFQSTFVACHFTG